MDKVITRFSLTLGPRRSSAPSGADLRPQANTRPRVYADPRWCLPGATRPAR